MDDQQPYKLKIKIGQHEFEAEGPADVVQKQFQSFKDLIAAVPELSMPPAPQPVTHSMTADAVLVAPKAPDASPAEEDLRKIMRVDERTVSLTVRPSSLDDAMLLILYGQKVLRSNELSTGADVMDGLTATGGFSGVKRVDRRLERIGRNGDIIVMGEHRSKKYRLTNSGVAKVRDIAAALIATVA